MNKLTHVSFAAAAACFLASAEVRSENPASEEVLYEENFERPAPNLGMRKWFHFQAGTSIKASAAEELGAGSDQTVGLVFRFSGADHAGLQSYWLAGLGRTQIVGHHDFPPENLRFSAFMKMPTETVPRTVNLRFIQGDSEKPSWSSLHRVRVEPEASAVSFLLGDGEIRGDFRQGEPISLHAIMFSHDRFGFNRDIEFVIDDVSVTAVQPAP